jgi:hypothetical protein
VNGAAAIEAFKYRQRDAEAERAEEGMAWTDTHAAGALP